ncbi:MAG: hypothetical protein EOP49_45350 [Sphingobacteriales bacterium]|nr:MAG: hypothetical protein EOP49_45350 [Sphingobacteriales bacterium]
MSSDNSGNSESSDAAHLIKTNKAYREAVKRVFELRKNSLFEGRLINPTPAGLRNIFRFLTKEGLTRADAGVLKSFLLDRNLDTVDVDRFRPLINFMRGATQLPDVEVVNLLAILVDYKLRPLNVFLSSRLDHPPYEDPQPAGASGTEGEQGTTAGRNRFVFWLFGILVVGSIGIYLFYKPTGCMRWNGHQYEKVECDAVATPDGPVHGFNASQFLVRRVKVSDTTTFFRAGIPQYWYLRNNGYEFFDHPGYHPESSRPLLPVSRIVARKVQSHAIDPRNP